MTGSRPSVLLEEPGPEPERRQSPESEPEQRLEQGQQLELERRLEQGQPLGRPQGHHHTKIVAVLIQQSGLQRIA